MSVINRPFGFYSNGRPIYAGVPPIRLDHPEAKGLRVAWMPYRQDEYKANAAAKHFDSSPFRSIGIQGDQSANNASPEFILDGNEGLIADWGDSAGVDGFAGTSILWPDINNGQGNGQTSGFAPFTLYMRMRSKIPNALRDVWGITNSVIGVNLGIVNCAFWTSGNGMLFGHYPLATNTNYVTLSSDPDIEEWHDWVWYWDGVTTRGQKIFVDGIDLTSTSVNVNWLSHQTNINSLQNLQIGPTSDARTAEIQVSQIRYYNRVLEVDEIRQLSQ